MAALPLVLMVAGSALSAYSSIREGQSASATAKANANVLQMQAEATQKSGAYEEAQLKRQKIQMLSRQQAAYAKSGVVLSEGSPLAVMSQTATDYEMDLAASRYNTATQVNQLKYQSSFQNKMASQYRTAGYLKAGSTLLTSASSYGKYGTSSKAYGPSNPSPTSYAKPGTVG